MSYDRLSYEQPTYSSYSREDLKDEIERLKAELTDLKAKVKLLGDYKIIADACDLDSREYIKRLREEESTLRADNERLKAERDNWQETARVEHNANHTLRARVGDLTSDVDGLHARLAVSEDNNNRTKNYNGELLDELLPLRARVVEVEDYNRQLEDAQSGWFSMEQERDTLKARIKELEEFIGERSYTNESVAVLEVRVEELEASLSKHKQMYYVKHMERDSLRDQLESMHTLSDCQEEELRELRDELEQIKGENMSDLHDRYSAKCEEVEHLKAELVALKPVPVVKTRTIQVQEATGMANVLLTYTDGKLTGATIIGDGR